MKKLTLFMIVFTFPVLAEAAECPVSKPDIADPVGTLSSSSAHGWAGNAALAAMIPRDGTWSGMGPSHAYRDKLWWWADGYSIHNDPDPGLTVVAEPIGNSQPGFSVTNATNGFGDGWQAMLVMMEFPGAGCWRVTGTYKGEMLEIVLNVAPAVE